MTCVVTGHIFVLICADIMMGGWSQFCVGLCRHHRLVTVLCWVVQTSQTSLSFVWLCRHHRLVTVICCVVQTSQTGHSFVFGCADITDWSSYML